MAASLLWADRPWISTLVVQGLPILKTLPCSPLSYDTLSLTISPPSTTNPRNRSLPPAIPKSRPLTLRRVNSRLCEYFHVDTFQPAAVMVHLACVTVLLNCVLYIVSCISIPSYETSDAIVT